MTLPFEMAFDPIAALIAFTLLYFSVPFYQRIQGVGMDWKYVLWREPELIACLFLASSIGLGVGSYKDCNPQTSPITAPAIEDTTEDIED